MFDQNDDGVIDFKELRTLFRLLGQNPTQQELSTMMAAVDRNSECTMNVLYH